MSKKKVRSRKNAIPETVLAPEAAEAVRKDIYKSIDEVRPILLKIGYKPTAVAFTKNRVENATNFRILECQDWFAVFKTLYIKEYNEAIAIVPESVWQMYRNLGTRGTFEQKNLIAKVAAVKKAWANRPSILRRSSSDGKKRQPTSGAGTETQRTGGQFCEGNANL